jgi:hypothetical protein
VLNFCRHFRHLDVFEDHNSQEILFSCRKSPVSFYKLLQLSIKAPPISYIYYTMPNRIHIPKPCEQDWDKMTPQKEGRLCAACQTTVVDFSNKTLDEIKAYFESHKTKEVCGNFLPMHTVQKNKWYDLLNWVESGFSRMGMRRLAISVIALLLIVTGCRSRRMRGAPAYSAKTDQLHVNHM